MKNRRVVITGLGALSAIGNSLDELWEGLKQGKNGAGLITKFDTCNHDTKFAFEIKNFDITQFIDKKAVRRMDPFCQYGIATSQMAIDDSQIDLEKIDRNRMGVIFGSGIGGIDTFENQCNIMIKDGPNRISPFFIPMMISDIAAGQISIRFGLKGPNYATTSACATSSHAIADGFMLVQRGSADLMLVGGAEAALTPLAVAGFNALRAISTWNDRYLEASRPFDKERTGFVMGEGSGSLILEEYEHAKARGAKIYGEIIGIGLTGDAFHVTAPPDEGEGAQRSMREALRDGGIEPTDIDYINAHGTSTTLNDLNETQAIKKVFGAHAYKLSISSTKSMTGHLLGAAGAIEAIATVMALKEGIIPPTINLTVPDPECDLDYTPLTAVKKEIKYAISNTFGFGGHNATLLFKKYDE